MGMTLTHAYVLPSSPFSGAGVVGHKMWRSRGEHYRAVEWGLLTTTPECPVSE